MRFEKWQALGNDYLILERDELAVRAHARARTQALRAALRRLRRRRAAALPRADPEVVADLRIYNPDGSRGRALRQRRARGDPLPAPPRLDRARQLRDRHRRRAHPPDRSPAAIPAAWTWAARASPPRTSPAGRPTARRAVRATARCTSSTSRSATRSARSTSPTAPRCRRSTCPRSAPRSKATRAFPTAPTSPGTPRSTPPTATPRSARRRQPADAARGIFERGVGETLSSGTGATGAAVASSWALRAGRATQPASAAWPRRARRARRRRAAGRGRRGSARASDRLGATRFRGVPQRGLHRRAKARNETTE